MTLYDDINHSHASGLRQAQHVFLGGNGLPERWAGREQFVVVEAGFGSGLNFLATWAMWRDDARQPRRLHFVSIEKYPMTADALAHMHATCGLMDNPLLRMLCAALRAQWPVLTPGLHRLIFDAGAVTLTLALGDVQQLVPRLAVGADAFYLNDLASPHAPEMWAPPVLRGLARLAREGATLATCTAANFVGCGFQDAGFEVTHTLDSSGKRDMTVARFAPRWTVRRHTPPKAARHAERHALVVGAGLAGCLLAARLAARGWRVTLLDRQHGPARETSAHRAAMLHPHLSPDDNLLARATRSGFWHTLARWQTLAAAGHRLTRGASAQPPVGAGREFGSEAEDAPARSTAGMLERAEDAADAKAKQSMLELLRLPSGFVCWLDPAEAEARTGITCPHGGLWFEQGDWIAPPDWCAAELTEHAEAIHWQGGQQAMALRREGDAWQVLGVDGAMLAQAPVLVVANALDAPRLLESVHPALAAALPLRPVRGQLSRVPVEALAQVPRAVICGDGYALPPCEGTVQAGASYTDDDTDTAMRDADHLENLLRLQRLTGTALREDPAALAPRLDGFAALRCVAPDRMPVIGAVPDIASIEMLAQRNGAKLAGTHLRELPRLPGLYVASAYASRGVTWAALGADCIVSALEGEPMPLESDLLAAIDPARFVLRGLRAGSHQRD